jgi:hypothetical protein
MDISKNEIPVVWYDFSIHGCSLTKKAKIISQETEQANTSESGTVSSMVSIIPKIWAKPIRKAEGKIRNHFSDHAIQIGNVYAVPITIYPKFKHDLESLMSEYYVAIDALLVVAQNGELYEIAKKQLSQIKDKENINLPSPDEIKARYHIEINIDCNFNSQRVQDAINVLSNDIKEKIEKDVKESAQRRIDAQQKAIMETVLNPVKEFIADIQDRCKRGDENKIQWKTLVDKIRHITEVLPNFNVNNDPEITKMFDTLKEKFGNLDKDLLKENNQVRQEAVKQADKILVDFSHIFG